VSGANKVNSHYVNVNDKIDLAEEEFGDIRDIEKGRSCPECSGRIQIKRGIEVGHIFKLGDKYSKSLKSTFLDKDGKEKNMLMGCYGIGVGRIIAAAIEQNHDQDGIVWPVPIAPFQAAIIPLGPKDSACYDEAFQLYDSLLKNNIDVLVDDRKERPGVKFKDADLLGIPIQVIIGDRNLKEGMVELKIRKDGITEKIAVGKISQKVIQLVETF